MPDVYTMLYKKGMASRQQLDRKSEAELHTLALFENPGEGLQQNLVHKLVSLSSREKLYAPPPLPPFLTKRHFAGEGGGGV